jgi:DNA-binding MarR family transcriptional regulator
LHRATQVAETAYTTESQQIDLTSRQLVVLMSVGALAGPSQTAVVEHSGIDRSTLADIVRRLLKKKLIARSRDKADARAYVLHLTEDGQRLVGRANRALATAEASLKGHLSPREYESLLVALGKLAQVKKPATDRLSTVAS